MEQGTIPGTFHATWNTEHGPWNMEHRTFPGTLHGVFPGTSKIAWNNSRKIQNVQWNIPWNILWKIQYLGTLKNPWNTEHPLKHGPFQGTYHVTCSIPCNIPSNMEQSIDPGKFHKTFLGTWNKEHFIEEHSLEHAPFSIFQRMFYGIFQDVWTVPCCMDCSMFHRISLKFFLWCSVECFMFHVP